MFTTPGKSIRTAAAVGMLALAGSAQAALFSFASDTSDRSWTFSGQGASVVDATGPNDYLTLHIDDNNGILPRIDVSTQFNANYTISYVGSVPLGGGAFSHNYLASGSYSFTDVATNTTILTVNFTNCLFTARGGQMSWFTTAALQGDNGAGATVSMTWNGAPLPGYDLLPGVLPGSFAFGHSALNSSGAIPYQNQSPGANLGANMLPTATWWSEASFSAIRIVPAPGSLALLGLGALAAMRRRR
jgi:hypothetical protein